MSIVYRRDRLSTYVYDPVTDTFSHKTDPSRPVSPIYEKPKVLKEHKRERRKNHFVEKKGVINENTFLDFIERPFWVGECNDPLVSESFVLFEFLPYLWRSEINSLSNLAMSALASPPKLST